MRIQLSKSGDRVVIYSPAKLNLVLDVLGKRPDGYHEIDSLLCPIALWDRLEIQLTDNDRIELELVLPLERKPEDPAWNIPLGASNLVVRAAEITRQTLGTHRGCRIRMEKNIPACAGLGGGSGNAAATVVGFMLLCAKWDRNLAAQICTQLGSDLNFFLGDDRTIGLTRITGRGEHAYLLAERPMLTFWLLHPPMGCSTAEVYSKVDRTGSSGKISEFLRACQNRQASQIGAALFNALQLPASNLNPWIEIQLQLLTESGCSNPLMTGSGSSCFGLVTTEDGVLRETGPTQRSELFQELKKKASDLGITRAYQVSAWYGDAIEQQIRR